VRAKSVRSREDSPHGPVTRTILVIPDLVGVNLNHRKDQAMLNWAITFLVVALIAAIFGFGVLSGTAMEIARILFFVFIVLFIISFFTGRRTPSA
jgi:uncharacterized membrane protein YtjA (UPF0391 family)